MATGKITSQKIPEPRPEDIFDLQLQLQGSKKRLFGVHEILIIIMQVFKSLTNAVHMKILNIPAEKFYFLNFLIRMIVFGSSRLVFLKVARTFACSNEEIEDINKENHQICCCLNDFIEINKTKIVQYFKIL